MKRLLYFSSNSIIWFITNNPINWTNRDIANSVGNKLTPTSAIGVFFDFLDNNGGLFTQKEYVEYAWKIPQWIDWKKELTDNEVNGINARLFRNFYPSAIDSLHVWAMLVETNLFAKCLIDIKQDTISKTDLIVWYEPNKKPIRIALSIDSDYNRVWLDYKRNTRGDIPKGLIDLKLPMDRKRSPGNKRWYNIDDLNPVINLIK